MVEEIQNQWSFWQNRFLHIVLIIIVGVLAYSNTFNVPFHLDDIQRIVENPQIKDLSYFIDINRVEKFDSFKFSQSRFVGFFTFALNYKINGLDVRGYHIFNLTVHLINALLVYLLITLSFKTPTLRDSELSPMIRIIALFASLLFVSHPIQTQAVTYIVQRFTSLATMFYLASLVFYITSRLAENRKKAISFYALSIISAVLAMKTKEIAFTLPLIIVLYEFMFLKGTAKKRFVNLLPILLTLIVIPLSLLDFNKPIGELLSESADITRLQTTISRWDYLFTQLRVIVTYIRLLVLPINQNLDYDYPVFHSFFDPQVFLSFLFLVSIWGFGVYMYNRNRLLSFGIFWFFITLSVESSVIPIQDVIFEHRVYLPSAGVFAGISVFLVLLLETARNPRIKKVILAVGILTLCFLSSSSFARNNVWKSKISLWEDVAMKSPNKARVHSNIADEYEKIGFIDKAIAEYKTAIRLDISFVPAQNNLAIIYCKQGLLDKAVEHYLLILKIDPSYYYAHNNLGNIYFIKGSLEKALEHFENALKLRPDMAETHNNIGAVYARKGLAQDAIREFGTAIRLRPEYTQAYINLGQEYEKLGLRNEAINTYEIGLKLSPESEDLKKLLSQALQKQQPHVIE